MWKLRHIFQGNEHIYYIGELLIYLFTITFQILLKRSELNNIFSGISECKYFLYFIGRNSVCIEKVLMLACYI